MHPMTTLFSATKDGQEEAEWEDAVVAGRTPGGGLRFAVADGATEAYDARRWVGQLVSSLVPEYPDAAPVLRTTDEAGFRTWVAAMQRRWVDETPPFYDPGAERKFHEDGSFATLLAGELTGLDGPTPTWEAVAVGDTVLFHVRNGELLEHFPDLTDADFGLSPDGVHTAPERMDGMLRAAERRHDVALLDGDLLFVATDALAHWMLRRAEVDAAGMFSVLAALVHIDSFRRLVDDQRECGDLKNDDVTLLRIRLSAAGPAHLVVCL